MTDAEKFLRALADRLPDDERLILCGFVGDPGAAPYHAWRPKPWRPKSEIVLNEKGNGYVSVASFRKSDDETFRRREEFFAAGRALMVDDVRTKVELSAVKDVRPSAIIETSPGNEQWWYFFAEPQRDLSKFDGLIAAFLAQKLLGKPDPGMGGVTRVGRLPGFVNGKPSAKGWVTKMKEFDPRLRYWPDQLMKGFKIEYVGFKEFWPPRRVDLKEVKVNANLFAVAYRWMIDAGMVKGVTSQKNWDAFDSSGWVDVHCPWTEEHTGAIDNGAAVRRPHADNNYFGAFKCHHGNCIGRGWSDLASFVSNQAIEELDAANRNAPAFEEKAA